MFLTVSTLTMSMTRQNKDEDLKLIFSFPSHVVYTGTLVPLEPFNAILAAQ